MSKLQTAPAKDKQPQESPRVRIRIPKGAKLDFKGFETAAVGQTASVTLHGKVLEIRSVERTEYDWDSGKTIEIEPTSCVVDGPNKPVKSMDDAIEASKVRV
jgi:hypothetical protein